MNLYGLLDAIIGKVNRSVKVDTQELGETLQKQARNNIGAVGKEENCNPNLLDNWYFLNPINQQGVTSWTSGYGIDRWKIHDGAGMISIADDGVTITRTGDFGTFTQFFKDFSLFLNKTITISALHPDGALTTGTITTDPAHLDTVFCNSQSGNGYFNFYSDGTTFAALRVFVNGDTPIKIKAIKLELGDTQTLAHQDSNGNWVLNEIPKYEEELLKCRQYDPYTGEYIGLRKFSQPRNLLDNSDFRNPINQRGFVSGSTVGAGKYFIDRWSAWGGEQTITFDGDGLYASNGIWQKFLGLEKYVGEKITLAAQFANGLLAVGSGTVSNTGSWEDCASYEGNEVYLKCQSTAVNQWSVLITGMPAAVQWVALYLGEYTADTLPEYQPKGYAVELAECRRYYYRIRTYGSYVLPLAYGHATAATTARVVLDLPIAFRTVPTLTMTNVKFMTKSGTASVTLTTQPSLFLALGTQIHLTVTTSGLTTNAPVILAYYGTENEIYYIEFSADL